MNPAKSLETFMVANGNVNIGPYIVPLLVVAVVALRLFRNKPRKVKPIRLFVFPVLIAFATAITLSQMGRPTFLWLAVDVLAVAAGIGVGYLSARHREFALDAESGEIMSRATPMGTIIFGTLFAVRYGLKLVFPQLNGGAGPYESPPAHFQATATVIAWTDAGLIFSAALLIASATTTWLRTRHLVEERRAQRAAKPEAKSDIGAPS
jgi:hypothetical protein